LSSRDFLLLVLALFAVWPVHYLVRHIRQAPRRRRDSRSATEYAWRRPYKATLSVIALVALGLLVLWVLLAPIDDRAFGPPVLALLATAAAASCLVHAGTGLHHGRIQVFLLGYPYPTVERGGNQITYWCEVIVAGFFGAVMFVAAIMVLAG
jgi:hypothetical protein